MNSVNQDACIAGLSRSSGIAEARITKMPIEQSLVVASEERGDNGRRSAAAGAKLRLLLVITRLTVGGDTNVFLDIAQYFRHHPIIEADIAAGPVPSTEIDLRHLVDDGGMPLSIIPALSNRADPRLMLKAAFQLHKVIRRGRYDIVHTHSSAAGVIGRIAAATARVPIIVHHVHGWGLQEGMPLTARYAYLGLERLCAHFTDRLIAVSQPTVQKGLAHHIGCEDKFAVIYNGIHLEDFCQQVDGVRLRRQLGLVDGCKLVGMIGRLDRQKNPLDFVRVAALVVPRYPKVQFVAIGDGTLRSECERLIAQMNLQNRCILLGFRNDVARILPLLAVVASTSLWEGLPVTFQEAMCAGKPIVANDVDGVSDVVRNDETGYLVTPHDPQQMADRIVTLLSDPQLCNRLGARARVESARFSTQKMLQELELLYTRLAMLHGWRPDNTQAYHLQAIQLHTALKQSDGREKVRAAHA